MDKDKKVCSYCATEIPVKAKICPNCKKDVRWWFKKHPLLSFMLLLIVIWSISNWIVWNTTINNTQTINKQEDIELPQYVLIDKVNLYNWWLLVDILIESYSKETSQETLQKVAKKIWRNYVANQVDIYCSLDAQKANYSSSFAEKNPNSLEKCFLWSFKF